MFRITNFLAASLLMLHLWSVGLGGMVLTFSPADTTLAIPGSGTTQLTFDVRFAANTGTQALKAYSVVVDLSPPIGNPHPQGISIISANKVVNFGQAFPPSFGSAEGDLFMQDFNNSTPINFTTTPTTIFNFTIAVDSTAAGGDYLLSFVNQNLLGLVDGNGDSIPVNQISLETATIHLQAVPEPSSLLLSSCAMLALLCIAFRKRLMSYSSVYAGRKSGT